MVQLSGLRVRRESLARRRCWVAVLWGLLEHFDTNDCGIVLYANVDEGESRRKS